MDLIRHVGADRVVMGSDCPADMSYTRPVDVVERLKDLTGNERDAIVGGNAARLVEDSVKGVIGDRDGDWSLKTLYAGRRMTLQLHVLIAGDPVLLACCPSPRRRSIPIAPIRVILSVPAGATPDVTARLVGPGMSELLGQPLVMDNRGGASGIIAAELVARSAPDGYTLFIASPGALTILPHMRKVSYDTLKDFAPIGLISIGPFLLIAHPSVPAKTVKDLIALAKAKPGELNYASAGNGTPNHLAMELFKHMARVNIVHVPYKGAPQAVTDVLAGHMNMMFNSIAPCCRT